MNIILAVEARTSDTVEFLDSDKRYTVKSVERCKTDRANVHLLTDKGDLCCPGVSTLAVIR
jgi:hypothetical protein